MDNSPFCCLGNTLAHLMPSSGCHAHHHLRDAAEPLPVPLNNFDTTEQKSEEGHNLSPRQYHSGTYTSGWPVGEDEFAAMGLHNRLGNR